MKCEHCGNEIQEKADRVALRGMYDCHLFHRINGKSVDEVIANWREHNCNPLVQLGRSMLCPAIVMLGKRELRRVGKMVFEDERGLEEWKQALEADPDIPRLLAAEAAL